MIFVKYYTLDGASMCLVTCLWRLSDSNKFWHLLKMDKIARLRVVIMAFKRVMLYFKQFFSFIFDNKEGAAEFKRRRMFVLINRRQLMLGKLANILINRIHYILHDV